MGACAWVHVHVHGCMCIVGGIRMRQVRATPNAGCITHSRCEPGYRVQGTGYRATPYVSQSTHPLARWRACPQVRVTPNAGCIIYSNVQNDFMPSRGPDAGIRRKRKYVDQCYSKYFGVNNPSGTRTWSRRPYGPMAQNPTNSTGPEECRKLHGEHRCPCNVHACRACGCTCAAHANGMREYACTCQHARARPCPSGFDLT